MVRLETDRLIIRDYRESDLHDYHKLLSDKKNMYYLDDIATNTFEESRKSLKEAIKLNKIGKARRFCVVIKETRQFAGACGYDITTPPVTGIGDSEQVPGNVETFHVITTETPAGKTGHMGWFIMPEFQNKGYITEAAKKVLEFAFLQDNCMRITTGCYKDNIPTQKVIAKIGFKQEAENVRRHDGQMKERLDFSLNKNEFIGMYCK